MKVRGVLLGELGAVVRVRGAARSLLAHREPRVLEVRRNAAAARIIDRRGDGVARAHKLLDADAASRLSY